LNRSTFVILVATLVILVVGAIFGLIAYLIVPGVSDTQAIDWIELLIQFVLAVAGVALVAGIRSRRQAS
jgi:hypothetical protein